MTVGIPDGISGVALCKASGAALAIDNIVGAGGPSEVRRFMDESSALYDSQFGSSSD